MRFIDLKTITKNIFPGVNDENSTEIELMKEFKDQTCSKMVLQNYIVGIEESPEKQQKILELLIGNRVFEMFCLIGITKDHIAHGRDTASVLVKIFWMAFKSSERFWKKLLNNMHKLQDSSLIPIITDFSIHQEILEIVTQFLKALEIDEGNCYYVIEKHIYDDPARRNLLKSIDPFKLMNFLYYILSHSDETSSWQMNQYLDLLNESKFKDLNKIFKSFCM